MTGLQKPASKKAKIGQWFLKAIALIIIGECIGRFIFHIYLTASAFFKYSPSFEIFSFLNVGNKFSLL